MNSRTHDAEAAMRLGNPRHLGGQQSTRQNNPTEESAGTDKLETFAAGDAANIMASDPTSLWRSLDLLRASSCKPSRSYLVPFADHLMIMRAKHYSYLDMKNWLKAHHGLSPSKSTLHHFFHEILKRMRRAESDRKANGTSEAPGITLLTAIKPEETGGKENKHREKARDAIRAVKERSTAAETGTASPSFIFDVTKPLITDPTH